MRKRSRLFAIAEYLRARRTGVTAEALAERFGVSLRTIYRDLDALRDAALPLHADRGRGGGYALDRAYTLPPLNFTAREAALLVAVGRWAIEMRLLPFSETLETALDKVRGALSTSAQREVLTLVDSIKFLGVPVLPAPIAVRRAVERAWFEQRPLVLRYRSKSRGLVTCTVRILAVVAERTFTVLHCENVETAERHGYRLDRIEAATLPALGTEPAVT